MTLHRAFALALLTASAASITAVGCVAESADDQEQYGTLSDELTSSKTVGDWSKFPDGEQCLAAVQLFYPAKFDAYLPLAGDHWTGGCAPHGACHIWLDRIPDPDVWERIPNDGKHLPSTYDVIIYPPHSGSVWGHAAAVDHVEGSTIFVMDDNYVAHEKKASKPHTVTTKAYGWYHLKKLPKTGGSSGSPSSGGTSGGGCVPGGYYCGGDKVSGDPDTLYQCQSNGTAKKIEACSRGCAVRPGQDDACRTCVVGGYYCGGDKLSGDPDTLYRCNSQGLGDVVKHCSKGCKVHAGTDDSCG